MPFVLDHSVAAGWFLESQATAYGDAVAERLRDDRALVPPLWELELANVLRTACLRGALDLQAAHQVAQRLAVLPIEVDRKVVPPLEILGLAMRFGLTAYDAAYLELGLRAALPIATEDGRLAEAARTAGVGVLGTGPSGR